MASIDNVIHECAYTLTEFVIVNGKHWQWPEFRQQSEVDVGMCYVCFPPLCCIGFHNICGSLSKYILFVEMKQSPQILSRFKGSSNCAWWISFYVSACNVCVPSDALCRLVSWWSGPRTQALTALDCLKAKCIHEYNLCCESTCTSVIWQLQHYFLIYLNCHALQEAISN